jgi:hypothetical protein
VLIALLVAALVFALAACGSPRIEPCRGPFHIAGAFWQLGEVAISLKPGSKATSEPAFSC